MTAGHLLTNGHYRVVVTAAGAGYSAWGDYQLTRWADDPTRDADGYFTYLRDLETGRCWSAGHQPVQAPADEYQVSANDRVVVIRRRDDQVEFLTEIAIARGSDIEWRRHTVTNLGNRPRRLELTTCLEVVLNLAGADATHPAFSNLFVQTEWVAGLEAVVAHRRLRSPEDQPLFMGHALIGPFTGDVAALE